MSDASPPLDRARMEREIAADGAFDVVVVGGGITGAGTFRDLALQGLRVLLVERLDFSSGASGALTRIAHGGFRYLERGEIGLVRESVEERDRLLANAPHAVRPIRQILPLRSRFGGLLRAPLRFMRLLPGRGLPGVVPMAIGGRLYDALAPRPRALPRSRAVFRDGLSRRFPHLSRRYAGALVSYEGRIHAPERIAIELIEDGVSAGSRSAALNYCAFVGASGGELILESAGERFGVTARAVVNAGGAHADRIAGLLGIAERMTGGVAGVHVLLDSPEAARALGDDLLFFEDDDPDPARRRLCAAYRIAADRVLLGTTERAIEDPDAAGASEADDRYLVAALAAALAVPGAAEARVVGRLVGVRPLVKSGEADLASRSRSHAVFRHAPDGLPVVTIVGGKWTTFRRMAEDAADAVLDILERPRCISTRNLAIGGGRDFIRDALIDRLVGEGLDRSLAERLVETYGSRAPRVADYLSGAGADPVSADGRLTRGEVAFLVEAEMASSADDIIRRRSDQFFRADDLVALEARIAGAIASLPAKVEGG